MHMCLQNMIGFWIFSAKILNFIFFFLEFSYFSCLSPHTSHLKSAKIIASDSAMTSLACHTLGFARNCLFTPPSSFQVTD